MARKNVITVHELLEEGFVIKHGVKFSSINEEHSELWNDLCEEFDFCNNELSTEEWEMSEVDESLKENSTKIDMLALKSLMGKSKKALIIRD